jgi:N-acetylated-alpha-linked acidic dipeptidase
LIRNVLRDIADPEHPGESLLIRWPDKQRYYPLGTGSDFTVFIHHLGIASADLRFSADSGSGQATSYGTYHSTYDSFSWMERYGDPGFLFHEKMSVVWGVCALRLADSLSLPFHHVDQAKAILGYVQSIKPMVTDPVAFAYMESVALGFHLVALNQASKKKVPSDLIDLTYNDRVAFAERKFLMREGGLPLRIWFKHVLQAPGLYLGYTADVIPGVVQAYRDQNDTALANKQAYIFANRVQAVARFLQFGDKVAVETS